jgi:hypothetical protein
LDSCRSHRRSTGLTARTSAAVSASSVAGDGASRRVEHVRAFVAQRSSGVSDRHDRVGGSARTCVVAPVVSRRPRSTRLPAKPGLRGAAGRHRSADGGRKQQARGLLPRAARVDGLAAGGWPSRRRAL